jgi:hypothetical protein
MFERPLGEVLALGYIRERPAPFDERAGNAPHSQFNGERCADRTAANDNYLVIFLHNLSLAAG